MLTTFIVSNNGDAPENTPAAVGTLRQAVFDANQQPDPDRIEFNSSLNSATITLTEGQLTITDSVTIDGRDSNGVLRNITINGGGGANHVVGDFDGQPIFNIFGSTSSQVEINGLTLTGGDAEFAGGAISVGQGQFSGPSLTVKNSLITGNASFDGGGGIYANGNLTVENSTITQNSTYRAGGGIDCTGNNHVLNVFTSTISGNDAVFDNGGGIFANGANRSVNIQSSQITNNHSSARGGGIYISGSANIQSSLISGNQSLHNGGGIFFGGTELTLESSELRDNSCERYGGGLYADADNGSITIDRSTFEDNKCIQSSGPGPNLIAAEGGGAYFVITNNSSLTMTDTTFSNNQALGLEANVGGLSIIAENHSNVVADRVQIIGNRADDDVGGLVMDTSNSTITVRNSTISGNTANHNWAFNAAAGVWAEASNGGINIIEYSTISDNRTITPPGSAAENVYGAGLFIINATGTTTTVRNSTISGNRAEGNGGGIKIAEIPFGGRVYIVHSTITNNRADSNNDGIGTGGGIHVGSTGITVTIDHTIVAGNWRGPGTTTRDDINGSVTATWSLIGDNTGSNLTGAAVGSPDVDGNMIGTFSAPIDARLAPLANNGGPTKTHALRPDSPAIDKGKLSPQNPFPVYDQRGDPFARVIDGDGNNEPRIDIGAFEWQPYTTPPTVRDVIVKGSVWEDQNVSYAYADVCAVGDQHRPVYLENADQIQVEFDRPITFPGVSALTILGDKRRPISETLGIVVDSVVYDPDTHTATWTLSDALGPGKYALQLSGVQGAGLGLDGEWELETVPTLTPDTYTDDPARWLVSGNGTAGGIFEFRFSVLPGDYNQDGIVTVADAQSGTVKDGNGDGQIDSQDTAIAQGNNLNTQLPFRAAGADYVGQYYNTATGLYDLTNPDDDLINGNDYLVWRSNFGNTVEPWTGADGDASGHIDAGDYVVWRPQVGKWSAWYPLSMGSGSGAAIVDFGNAPNVANVIISGSNSTHNPYSFDAHDGSGEQLRTVPVGGADTISITFSEDVNVDASYLRVVGLRTFNVPTVADFTYDMATMTATWRFESLQANDHYLISLSDAVTDIEGNRLDGEWVNPVCLSEGSSYWGGTSSVVSHFPSGDGYAGGNFNFIFTLLGGDANLDDTVTSADYYIWSSHAYGPGGSFQLGDFNGDGVIDSADIAVWTQHAGADLTGLWMVGDLNFDGAVNDADLAVVAENQGLSNATWQEGDLNFDGHVNEADLELAFAQYGMQYVRV